MPLLVTYLFKLSVSLAVVFLFYYFILRKLTFYNHNRWYLLGYTLISFFIPLINISPVLQQNNWDNNSIVTWVPVLRSNGGPVVPETTRSALSSWDMLIAIIAVGILIMLVRLLRQLFSIHRMMKKAVPLTAEGMQLYQVNADIIPFSFGNSIFINSGLHSEEELKEIIRHEFVHVKQKHSLDILWAELLCLLNWFNPFAWLLKKAIRQNLEFIADNKVLEKGTNKKEYQYLLLKVTGNSQYSIATQFNFSSLKKRIVMMNKTKSAKRQLARLLFLLPATAVLLLAFRSNWKNTADKYKEDTSKVHVAGLVVDAHTMEPLSNATIYVKEKNITVQTDEKGYYLLNIPFENKELLFTMLVTKAGYAPIHQSEHWGNFTIPQNYERYGHTIEIFGLSVDKDQSRTFSTIASNAPALIGLSYENVVKRFQDIRNDIPVSDWYENNTDTIPQPVTVNGYNITKDFLKRNPSVSRVGWSYSKTDDVVRLVITKNDGAIEEYNMENDADVRRAEAKYGKLPTAPPPPPAPPTGVSIAEMPAPPSPPHALTEVRVEGMAIPPTPPVAGEIREVEIEGVPLPPEPPIAPKLPANVEKMNVNNNQVTITLKNGQVEKYDLNKPEEKKKFESKYGKVLTRPRVIEERRTTGTRITTARETDRGNGSSAATIITAAGEPLYVADGLTVTRSELEAIKPSAIERVNVLKGAKATDAYGSAGNNGVVEITTRTAASAGNPVTVTGYKSSNAPAPASNDLVLSNPEISITKAEKLVILDGKEKPAGTIKLKGNYKLNTLSEEEAVKKYGEKGRKGALEITTVN